MPRLTLLTTLFALIAFIAPAQSPLLENASARLRLDPQHGGLEDLVDPSAGHDHIDATTPALWTLTLADNQAITPDSAARFSFTPSANALDLHWSGFSRSDAPDLRVIARVALEGPESRWTLRVEGLANMPLRDVHFPRLVAIAPQPHETLAVPVWMGERTSRARELLNKTPEGGRRQWEYPGLLSMQCMTLYRDNGPGLLLSTTDTTAQHKRFAVFGDGQGGLGLEVIHSVPAGAPLDAYELPCEVRIALFNGDWFTAAERYRAWAQQQPWVRESRLRRGLTPSWLRETGLWVWNRGRSPGVLGPAAALQEAAGVPVSVFWHWWHGCSYDTGFPEYLPPREGEEPFRQAVAQAHAKGLHAIVYMNQRLWGMNTQSWAEKNAERYAVKGPDGRVSPEVYNTFTKAPNASMCMGTPFWRDTYAGLADAAVRHLGVDGIYMDQACSSLACYDPAHGHPLGGGDYWMKGFHLLESDIRNRTADVKPVMLAGEGCGEAWLPRLDAMLSLQVSMERYASPGQWEPIPFFHAVYHDVATFYGNYSSLTRPPYDDLWPREFAPERPLELLDRKFATQFRLEQGRAFVWGQQPTLANFQPSHLTDRRKEMDFVIRLAQLRLKAAKFLRDGTMLRPPALVVPDIEIPMSRLSIYAGQHDAVKEFTKTVPPVLAAAWQAPDGDIALAIVNICDAPVPLHLTYQSRTLDTTLPPAAPALYTLHPQGFAPFP